MWAKGPGLSTARNQRAETEPGEGEVRCLATSETEPLEGQAGPRAENSEPRAQQRAEATASRPPPRSPLHRPGALSLTADLLGRGGGVSHAPPPSPAATC